MRNLWSVWRDWLSPTQRDLAMTLITLLRQCSCTVAMSDKPESAELVESLQEVQ
jgi:hypothetical protein